MSPCVKPDCTAVLPAGTNFCSACGTRQTASCSACGAVLDGGRFCSACGAPAGAQASALPGAGPGSQPAPPPKLGPPSSLESSPTLPPGAPRPPSAGAVPLRASSPEGLDQYREILKGFAEDGVLDEGELSALRDYARELGVTSHDHERLVEGSKLFIGAPLELALDPKTCFLKAGSPSTLTVSVRNCLTAGKDMIREVSLTYRCSTSSRIETRRVLSVPSRGRKKASFTVDAPPHEGQYRLDGTVEAHFLDGRVFRGVFEVPGLMAAGDRAHTGPQSVTLNMGDANMIKGAGFLGGGASEQNTGEIRVASGTWQTIEVEPVPEALIDEWRVRNQDAGSAAVVRADAGVRGEPLPCRGLVLRVQQQTSRVDAAMNRDIWVMRGDAFTMGRDGARADVQAAIEPFHPPAEHPHNVSQSMRISSLHLQVRLSDRGAAVTDMGSSNGTTSGGRPIDRQVPLPVAQGMEVTLGGALTLRPEVLIGDDGHAHALYVARVNNVPERSYVLAPGGLGLWPADYRLVGPRQRDGRRAPVVLDWHLGGLCVRNVGMTGLVRVPFGGAPARVPVGQRVALDERDRIQLGERWVLFVADVLALRPGTF